jgi:hypothetical protein
VGAFQVRINGRTIHNRIAFAGALNHFMSNQPNNQGAVIRYDLPNVIPNPIVREVPLPDDPSERNKVLAREMRPEGELNNG